MAFTLGQAPESMRVVLVEHADFYAQFRRKDGSDWVPATDPPTVVQLILDFGATEWPATFQGSVATFTASDADVDTLIASRPREVRLWYIENDMRLLWAQGDIDVYVGERL